MVPIAIRLGLSAVSPLYENFLGICAWIFEECTMPQNGFGFESGKLVMMHLFPECDFCSRVKKEPYIYVSVYEIHSVD